MHVWIDVTNSPHVTFFRPLIALLRARGHEVDVTARAFAQTLELLADADIDHDVVGPPHGGATRAGKARAMTGRLRALRRWAHGRGIDVGLSHASHELPVIARLVGIPSAYAFDYEYAFAQHSIGCRAARRVVVPDVIPQERLERIGARERKTLRYPGLKEEYYLHGFEPDRSVLDRLELGGEHLLAVVRTPPDVSLYHRRQNTLYDDLLERLGRADGVRAVVLTRTPAQRRAIVARALPGLVVPERALDALSLVALADLVVSAGGTMNREAVALGTPVWTVFAERLGAVDERLVEQGRLQVLHSAGDLRLEPKPRAVAPTTRDPALMLDLLLSALG